MKHSNLAQEELTTTFTALSDPTRLRIVEFLMEHEEAMAGDLAGLSDLSVPAVSRHLKVLREAGVVSRRAVGTHRAYSLRPQAIRAVAEWSMKRAEFWEGSLDRLESLMQETRRDGRSKT